jgi:uncharacterized membrane protein
MLLLKKPFYFSAYASSAYWSIVKKFLPSCAIMLVWRKGVLKKRSGMERIENMFGAFLLISAMWLFFFIATRHARQKDALKQLTDTAEELAQGSYATKGERGDGHKAWVELTNPTTRIYIVQEDGREELWISLFLPHSEASGANATHLSRVGVHGLGRGGIAYERTNKLSGRLLYYATGMCGSQKAHTLFDKIVQSAYAHHTKNERAASV